MEDWNNGILDKTKKDFFDAYSTIPSFQWLGSSFIV